MNAYDELQRDIAWFFTPPNVKPEVHRRPDGAMSTLYLLRREVLDCLTERFNGCLITEDQALAPQSYQRLFPSVIVICCGIDLLSKFVRGKDHPSQAGERFQAFLTLYSGVKRVGTPKADERLKPDEVEAIWLLRNAQVHSFGLLGLKKSEDGSRWEPYPLALLPMLPDGHRGPKIAWHDSGTWVVCVNTFYEMFLGSIATYEEQLRAEAKPDNRLGKAFTKMFGRYGHLAVG